MEGVPLLRSAEDAWRAVEGRDEALDGAFVYAVVTTGVYCRPSCPSRRPRRENVRFFSTPEEARREGFRACARCGPDSSAVRARRAVEQAVKVIEHRLSERLTLRGLGKEVGLSPYHLQRTFKRLCGLSPRAFQDACRLSSFKERVRSGESVGEAAYGAGYGSSRGLYESARARLGMTPGTYRRGGEGETIRFATCATILGRLLLAATDRGVCAVAIGEGPAEVEAGLRDEFPRAELLTDAQAVRPWLEAVARQIEGGPPARPPLDVRGTSFQRLVWKALCSIPYGETRSYKEVARSIGHPRGARAVARACAGNRIAVVIPCHRVVRAGGELGGYRWGTSRKGRLLDIESARSSKREDLSAGSSRSRRRPPTRR
jgi:AraC family transcriptional regulator, regulatory protein of adaptative response / methylated-DNA-[protein]-cysteine methyltransferase